MYENIYRSLILNPDPVGIRTLYPQPMHFGRKMGELDRMVRSDIGPFLVVVETIGILYIIVMPVVEGGKADREIPLTCGNLYNLRIEQLGALRIALILDSGEHDIGILLITVDKAAGIEMHEPPDNTEP